MGSLTVELFLRELCFWFVVAPGAFPGRADHCVLLWNGQCLLIGRGCSFFKTWLVVQLDYCSYEPFTDVCLLQSNFTRQMWLEAMAEIRLEASGMSRRNKLESTCIKWGAARVLEVE